MKESTVSASATIREDGTGDEGRARFVVSGTLGFDTVPDLMKQARRLFTAHDCIVVDFSEVDNCNSTGLAVVLEIAREMRQNNKSVCFQSLPEQIHTFARAYSIDKAFSDSGLLC